MTVLRRLWYLVKLLRRAGGVQGMKDIAANAPKYLTLCRRLLADNRVPASAKAVLLGAGAFAASPLNISRLHSRGGRPRRHRDRPARVGVL